MERPKSNLRIVVKRVIRSFIEILNQSWEEIISKISNRSLGSIAVEKF